MTIEITSASFLEVADKVEAFKQQGYALQSAINLNENNEWTATVTKDAEEINVENVTLDKPKRGPKKATEAEV